MNKLLVVNFGFCSNNSTEVYLACKFILYKVYTIRTMESADHACGAITCYSMLLIASIPVDFT